MPEHRIPRAHLHEDLLELYRRDREVVCFLDPAPDEQDRVRVVTVIDHLALEQRS